MRCRSATVSYHRRGRPTPASMPDLTFDRCEQLLVSVRFRRSVVLTLKSDTDSEPAARSLTRSRLPAANQLSPQASPCSLNRRLLAPLGIQVRQSAAVSLGPSAKCDCHRAPQLPLPNGPEKQAPIPGLPGPRSGF